MFVDSFDKAAGLHFSGVVAQLVEGVVLFGELIGRKDGIMDVAHGPAVDLAAEMHQGFHHSVNTCVLGF